MFQRLDRPTRPIVLAALLAAAFPLGSAVAAAGEAEKPRPAASPSAKREMTPEEHLAKAAEYEKKAATYRAEAVAHSKMLEEYRNAGAERPDEDPYVTKMRIHCGGYSSKAEALATEAQSFADLHRKRAAELQGKSGAEVAR